MAADATFLAALPRMTDKALQFNLQEALDNKDTERYAAIQAEIKKRADAAKAYSNRINQGLGDYRYQGVPQGINGAFPTTPPANDPRRGMLSPGSMGVRGALDPLLFGRGMLS